MENTKQRESQKQTECLRAEQVLQTQEMVSVDTHAPGGSHHNRHHNHFGHHHSRHHDKAKHHRTMTNFGKFLSKHKAVLVNIVVISLAFLSVFAIAYIGELRYNAPEDSVQGDQSNGLFTDSSLRVEVPLFSEDVCLVGEAVMAYINVSSTVPIGDVVSNFENTEERLDLCAPVNIFYQILGVPKNCSVQFVTLTVSECKDDTASKTIKLGGDATSAQLKFLKTGTQYDYRLTFRLSNAVETTVSGTLRTAATPRILNIGGLVNVRDIGGWKTVDGKRIRQGLLYRGSEMDGAVHAEYRITENGISDMLTVLGIRSDIDLRTALGESARSALGANVNYLSYTFPAYTGIFSTDYRSEICRVFADLAKPEIYPAYLHCTYGMDRTGTACYLLEALLGVAEEDLMRDYELSGLVHTGLTRENLIGMVAQLNTFEGDTLQQKVEHYLLDIGVTQQQISSIRHILLEDK